MNLRAGFVVVLFWTICVDAFAQDRHSPLDDASNHFSLNQGLTEISGLAVASQDSVYAHNDEHGIVYEIALADGRIIAAFALGEPTVKADFEGIAAFDGRVYLITSAGLVYESKIGPHRARVRFNIFDTGVGDFCEAEGITPGPSRDEFLIICKTAHKPELDGRLVVFKWSLAERLPVHTPWLNVKESDFLTPQERKKFRPSAIEWRAQSNSLVVLSARSHLFLNLRRDGKITV